MEHKPSQNTNSGRLLVAGVLALVGVIFGVSAALADPSNARLAFIVIAIVMIGTAGGLLGATLARKGKQ